MIRKLTAAALGAATALVATSALAQDPAAAPAPAAAAPAAAAAPSADSGSTGGLSAAVLLGYGFGSVGGGGQSVNPYGLGLGARIGYTLPMNLYIGGTFVYHLGGSLGSGSESISFSTWYIAPEVGYEIAAGPVMVRPYVGIGLAEAHEGSVTVDGITVGGGSTSGVVFYPGATVLYPVTSNIGVGADARFTIFSANGTSDNALALFLTGVYHF